MHANRTIWSGVAVTAVGWAFLLWAILAPVSLPGMFGATGPALGQHNFVTLSQSVLFTGLLVVLVGVLREGFGALDRFFETIVRRTNRSGDGPGQPAGQPRTPVTESRPQQKAAAPAAQKPAAKSPLPPQKSAPQAPAAQQALASPPKVMDEGILRGRAYVLYTDGSVEVDTLLGRKRFETMEAAIAYVGVGGSVLHQAA